MRFHLLALCILFTCTNCQKSTNPIEEKEKPSQEEIITQYLKEGAWKYPYTRKEWDYWIEKGLAEDSTIAYLWQQRAMPLWKTKKYALAEQYYRKAIRYNRERYLPRSGYLKTIFSKDYKGAIENIDKAIAQYGNSIVQDHYIILYKGICYLQLNQYQKAHQIFQKNINQLESELEPDWIHHLDYFYLGVALYELGEYQKAIQAFEKGLNNYPKFSDALYFKAICLQYLNKEVEAENLYQLGKSYYKSGYTINEDGAVYETFPYQITWQWGN